MLAGRGRFAMATCLCMIIHTATAFRLPVGAAAGLPGIRTLAPVCLVSKPPLLSHNRAPWSYVRSGSWDVAGLGGGV